MFKILNTLESNQEQELYSITTCCFGLIFGKPPLRLSDTPSQHRITSCSRLIFSYRKCQRAHSLDNTLYICMYILVQCRLIKDNKINKIYFNGMLYKPKCELSHLVYCQTSGWRIRISCLDPTLHDDQVRILVRFRILIRIRNQ